MIRLQQALKNLYNLNATLIKNKSKKSGETQYLLPLSNKEAFLLKVIIKPFMLDSLLYKLDF